MKTKLLALLCLILLLARPGGAGETIKVYFGLQPWSDAAQTLIADFEKETGIKVDLEVYGEQQLSQKLAVMFASGNADLDVFQIRPLLESRLLQKNGWAEDLTKYTKDDKEYDIDDYPPASFQITKIDGVQTCIPILSENQIIYYRKDIFDEKGLKPPTNFRELEEVAKQLTRQQQEFYGFVSRGARNPVVTQFSSYLYGFGGDFFDQKTRKSLIDTPEFLYAAEFYGMMLKRYGPPGALNMGWTQAIAVFQQGKGAMYIDSSSQYPTLLDPAKSAVAGKVGIAPFPAGPKQHKFYSITSWGIAISAQSKKKEAAWKFVRWFTDKKRTTILQGDHAVQCVRTSTYNDPDGVKKYPPDLIETLAQGAKYGVGYDRPLVTQVEQARDIIGTVVVTAIEGGDVKKAAAVADKAFQELLDKEK